MDNPVNMDRFTTELEQYLREQFKSNNQIKCSYQNDHITITQGNKDANLRREIIDQQYNYLKEKYKGNAEYSIKDINPGKFETTIMFQSKKFISIKSSGSVPQTNLYEEQQIIGIIDFLLSKIESKESIVESWYIILYDVFIKLESRSREQLEDTILKPIKELVGNYINICEKFQNKMNVNNKISKILAPLKVFYDLNSNDDQDINNILPILKITYNNYQFQKNTLWSEIKDLGLGISDLNFNFIYDDITTYYNKLKRATFIKKEQSHSQRQLLEQYDGGKQNTSDVVLVISDKTFGNNDFLNQLTNPQSKCVKIDNKQIQQVITNEDGDYNICQISLKKSKNGQLEGKITKEMYLYLDIDSGAFRKNLIRDLGINIKSNNISFQGREIISKILIGDLTLLNNLITLTNTAKNELITKFMSCKNPSGNNLCQVLSATNTEISLDQYKELIKISDESQLLDYIFKLINNLHTFRLFISLFDKSKQVSLDKYQNDLQYSGFFLQSKASRGTTQIGTAKVYGYEKNTPVFEILNSDEQGDMDGEFEIKLNQIQSVTTPWVYLVFAPQFINNLYTAYYTVYFYFIYSNAPTGTNFTLIRPRTDKSSEYSFKVNVDKTNVTIPEILTKQT